MFLVPRSNITVNEPRVDTLVMIIGSEGECRRVFSWRPAERPHGLTCSLIVAEVWTAGAVAIIGAELALEEYITRDCSDKIRLFLCVLQVRCLVQDAGSGAAR